MTPAFDNVQESWQRPDWELLHNGFVALFMAEDWFAETKAVLMELGYSVVELNAREWRTPREALLAFGKALQVPDHYGENLDALADCLGDVAMYDYGSDAAATGPVIALDHDDKFVERDAQFAWELLDILAGTGRQALLIGHRLFAFVRSDNSELSLPAVGATPVVWNRREFLQSSRG